MVHIADRYMSTSEILHIIVASLAMVGHVAKKSIQVVHYLRKNKLLSIDMDVSCGSCEEVVDTIGESISDSFSPLHLLPELRHLYRRAVFHILARRRISNVDPLDVRKTHPGLPPSTGADIANNHASFCSVVNLPNVSIDPESKLSFSAMERNTGFKSKIQTSFLDDKAAHSSDILTLDVESNTAQRNLEGDAVLPETFTTVQIPSSGERVPSSGDDAKSAGTFSDHSSNQIEECGDVLAQEIKESNHDIGAKLSASTPLSSSSGSIENSSEHSTPFKLVLKKAKDIWDD